MERTASVTPGLETTVLECCAVEIEDFDAVVRLYRPRVFRFLLASLRDQDAAETLTQECFLKAYNGRKSFRGQASVSTWLIQIALNLARDHARNRRIQFWKRMKDPGDNAAEISEWLPDRHSSPEARVAARQQVETVWRAAARLPERQRAVFLLRFVEEMELHEIATAMDMKEGTVKSHLFRAVQTVRERLESGK